MSEQEKELYEFGQFRLDVAERFLARSATNERVQLSEKAFETLCILVRNAGHLVKKDELLNQVWADSFVEENNLNKSIHAVRRALGEKPGEQQFIETVKKHGFRFVVEVRRVEEEGEKERKGEREKNISLLAETDSPHLPVSLSHKGAVVALADWRREQVRGEAIEQISSSTQPEESTEQTTKLESIPTKLNSENKHAPKYRPPLAALTLAAFLIGAMALGYYFYNSKKASSAGGKKSIAVLPLKPINAINRDEIYETGIADSLILKLSSMKGFIVRPLSATRKYADIEQDAIAAGREQQVDYVLASNYQLAGGKIRVTSQLFNVASGEIEETYKSEQDAGNVFAMQDTIAGEVENKLSARFGNTANSSTAKRGTSNEEAYRLYLQGRNLTFNRTAAAARKAVEYFEQSIRLDPSFARAYSGMAHAFITSGNLGGDLPAYRI